MFVLDPLASFANERNSNTQQLDYNLCGQNKMGKQYNKIEKRVRRKNYLKRKREKTLAAKKLSKSTTDTKVTAKKAATKKTATKKAATKKTAAKKSSEENS